MNGSSSPAGMNDGESSLPSSLSASQHTLRTGRDGDQQTVSNCYLSLAKATNGRSVPSVDQVVKLEYVELLERPRLVVAPGPQQYIRTESAMPHIWYRRQAQGAESSPNVADAHAVVLK
jgi:hypothetical protein